MKFLPFCGKNGSGNAQPINVNTDGALESEHVWDVKQTKICDGQEIRSTDVVNYPTNALDVSDYAITSIRVLSSLDQTVTLTFLDDASGRWACDASGGTYQLTISNSNQCYCITPDDIPFLNYTPKIHIRVKADTAPTSGSLSIWVVSRR